MLTPLALALIMVETTDLIFAVDSIPAIFAITADPFLVFTSNVFAILGLRSLYFALAGHDRQVPLPEGVAGDRAGGRRREDADAPRGSRACSARTSTSTCSPAVLLILAAGVIASMIANRRTPADRRNRMTGLIFRGFTAHSPYLRTVHALDLDRFHPLHPRPARPRPGRLPPQGPRRQRARKRWAGRRSGSRSACSFSVFVYFGYENHWLGLGTTARSRRPRRRHVNDGHAATVKYLTGYLIEKSPRVDNIFVIVVIFAFFARAGALPAPRAVLGHPRRAGHARHDDRRRRDADRTASTGSSTSSAAS